MRKPVNDLSRGAFPVDDIVYTVALTAIQVIKAAQAEEKVVN